ncbi:MAG: futalosine hydrolase [Phycisphaerales bacterium]|nr:futalosine hydrolase [Phycisphaerales bacterium]
MRLLIIVAVDREADAFRSISDAVVVAGGVGRTNAAVATTRSILEEGPFDAVLSMGIAGSLPGRDCSIGDVVVGSRAVYFEEGIETPEGFSDLASLGFPLGDFEGNEVPADPALLDRLKGLGILAPIATVATCSGTDRAAGIVAQRTGAVAEAMEGAAVLHAARVLGVPSLELRVISNTTGNRDEQVWDLPRAFEALSDLAAALALHTTD